MEEYDFGETQDLLGVMEVYADIVYCIDLTSGMTPVINKVKETLIKSVFQLPFCRHI